MRLLLKIAYFLLRLYWFIFRPVTLGVRVLMVRNDQVLLVRHTYQDAWFLPGGGVKRRESLEQAARREVKEECGATLEDLQLVGIYTNLQEYKSDHTVLFLSKDFSLTLQGDAEIARAAFFDMDQLPADISPGSCQRIREYQRGDLGRTRWGAW
jgi:ADP-ribose pyrophosphatase YjhB (NUDIX family)